MKKQNKSKTHDDQSSNNLQKKSMKTETNSGFTTIIRPAHYIGSFLVDAPTQKERTEIVYKKLETMRNVSQKKSILLVISLSGIKVCSENGDCVKMAHALRRISYATSDPDYCQFSFLAREPKGQANAQYCHTFLTENPNLAEELNDIVGEAFRLAYARQNKLTSQPREINDETQNEICANNNNKSSQQTEHSYNLLQTTTTSASSVNDPIGNTGSIIPSRPQQNNQILSHRRSVADSHPIMDNQPPLLVHKPLPLTPSQRPSYDHPDDSPTDMEQLSISSQLQQPTSQYPPHQSAFVPLHKPGGKHPSTPCKSRLELAPLPPKRNDSLPMPPTYDTPGTNSFNHHHQMDFHHYPKSRYHLHEGESGVGTGPTNTTASSSTSSSSCITTAGGVAAAPLVTTGNSVADGSGNNSLPSKRRSLPGGMPMITTNTDSLTSSGGSDNTDLILASASRQDNGNDISLDNQWPYKWYQSNMPREVALELLLSSQIGSFVVRDSTSHSNCYALSVRVSKQDNSSGVIHYLIQRTSNNNGGFRLKGLDKEWPTMKSLVTHLTVMPEMLPCALIIPTHHSSAGSSSSRCYLKKSPSNPPSARKFINTTTTISRSNPSFCPIDLPLNSSSALLNKQQHHLQQQHLHHQNRHQDHLIDDLDDLDYQRLSDFSSIMADLSSSTSS